MNVTALLVFMVLSQIAVASYLLYSFSDVEREAKKRMTGLQEHIDSRIEELERRLSGTASPLARKRTISAVGS